MLGADGGSIEPSGPPYLVQADGLLGGSLDGWESRIACCVCCEYGT